MQPADLREILLAKAIEEADPSGRLLPWAERERAARDALRGAGLATDDVLRPAADGRVANALSARARQLVDSLRERHPILGDLSVGGSWPRWTILLLLAMALAGGYGMSAMNGSHRINILALPFLGLLAWNFFVYAWVLVAAVRHGMSPPKSGTRLSRTAVRSIGRRLGPLVARAAQVDTLLADAVRRFVTDWSRLGAPVLAHQLRQWLHLAAAMLAVGLVAGLYQRGLVNAYVAGWESTWLGAHQVQWLVKIVFGPVAAWAGLALPVSVEEVSRLQFQADGSGGQSAAPWIHLIALVLLAAVIVPRLALAAIAGLQARRLRQTAHLPPELAAYARTALGAGGQGLALSVAVVPYAYQPTAVAVAALEAKLKASLGRGARAILQPPLAYGDEESLPSRFEEHSDGRVLLLNLAATPEIESHGRLLRAFRQAGEGAAPCRTFVDETAYAARFGADVSLAGRMEERRALWREFASGHGVDVEFLAEPTR